MYSLVAAAAAGLLLGKKESVAHSMKWQLLVLRMYTAVAGGSSPLPYFSVQL